MKKYETVIFDLDGTLLYTLEDLTKATNYALRRMNMPERTLDDVRRFVGNGVARLIELAVPEGTAPEVFEQTLAIFREYYDIHCNDNTKAYDGVIDLLRELKADGYALAIVSNKPDSAVKELAEIYFEDCESGNRRECRSGEKTGAGYGLCGIKGAWHAKGGRRVCRRFRGGCDDSEKFRSAVHFRPVGIPGGSVLKRTWCRSFCPRTGGDQRFPECVGLLRNVSLLVKKYHCMVFVHKVQ